MATRRKNTIKDGLDKLIPAVGGAVAASLIQAQVPKMMPSLDPKIQSLLPMAVGAFLAATQKGKLADAGIGIMAASTPAVMSSFNLGIGAPNSGLVAGSYVAADDTMLSEADIEAFEDMPIGDEGEYVAGYDDYYTDQD